MYLMGIYTGKSTWDPHLITSANFNVFTMISLSKESDRDTCTNTFAESSCEYFRIPTTLAQEKMRKLQDPSYKAFRVPFTATFYSSVYRFSKKY